MMSREGRITYGEYDSGVCVCVCVWFNGHRDSVGQSRISFACGDL